MDENIKYIEFGMKSLGYAMWNTVSAEFDAVNRILGARAFTLSVESSDSVQRADDSNYMSLGGAETITAEMTTLTFPQSYRIACLGYTLNPNGMETDKGTRRPHALQFLGTQLMETGDERPVLFTIFSGLASKPGISKTTKEAEVEGEEKVVALTLSDASNVMDVNGNPVAYGITYWNEANAQLFELAKTQIILPSTLIPVGTIATCLLTADTEQGSDTISGTYSYVSNDDEATEATIELYAATDTLFETQLDVITDLTESTTTAFEFIGLTPETDYVVRAMQGDVEMDSVTISTIPAA